MKKIKNILPISDIHLETFGYNIDLSGKEIDVVLLAGDIGNKFQAVKFIENLLEQGVIVVYVLGNHEFYNINNQMKTIYEIKDGWKEREQKYDNLYVLDNESIIIDDVKIIGTTFWSKLTPENYNQEESEYLNNHQSDLTHIYKKKNMSGYRIKSGVNIKIEDYQELHSECLKYTSEEINKEFDGTVILLSHYPLLKESQSLKHDNSFESQFYSNDYEKLVIESKLDYIVHGHIHESFNYKKGNVNNICNPLGYQKYNEKNKDFNEDLIIKI